MEEDLTVARLTISEAKGIQLQILPEALQSYLEIASQSKGDTPSVIKLNLIVRPSPSQLPITLDSYSQDC